MGAKASIPVPRYFPTEASFRRWLERHHATVDVLWVGYYKKATGKPSITWEESRDQALCFGWIDGIRKSVDPESFTIRFTPRRPGSMWSTVNIGRVQALKQNGLMTSAGLEAFARRESATSRRYSFVQGELTLNQAQARTFRANRKAWTFFQMQPPSYRKMATWWVLDAKKEETRERRLHTLIKDSAAGRRIGPLGGNRT